MCIVSVLGLFCCFSQQIKWQLVLILGKIMYTVDIDYFISMASSYRGARILFLFLWQVLFDVYHTVPPWDWTLTSMEHVHNSSRGS